MRIDVITIFPELFDVPLRTSIIGRAAEAGIVQYGIHDLREHGLGRHRSVDDEPYGGGAGMVMRPEPLFAAIEPLRAAGAEVVLLDPAGERLTDALARDLARSKHLALVCGRYEGIDHRVRTVVDREVSIGDYVLTGGELPALVLIDAVVRLLPGAIRRRPIKATRSRPACWSTRSTPARSDSAISTSPRSCWAATTERWTDGAGARRCAAPSSGGRTSSIRPR